MHVSAPVAIWTYVYRCLSAGSDLIAIWTCVCACFSACGHMGLRLCMFGRRRRYGVTFLYIAAPAVIWTYVYAYESFASGGAIANVAVVSVSCTLRSLRRERQILAFSAALEFRAHLAQKWLANTAKAECRRVRRSTAR